MDSVNRGDGVTVLLVGVAGLLAMTALTIDVWWWTNTYATGDNKEDIPYTIESVKSQLERGVAPTEITCRDGLYLLIKTDQSPACVKSETIQKLISRGVAHMPPMSMPMSMSPASSIKDDHTSTKDQLLKENVSLSSVTKNQTAPEERKDVQVYDLYAYIQEESNSRQQQPSTNIDTVPASSGAIVNFYITDQDLNTAHNGIETISTDGLLEFTINGISIQGPENMIETGANTGRFYVRLELPDSINGKPLSQDDTILIKYLDRSDSSGNSRTVSKSVPLTSTFASMQTVDIDKKERPASSRIGHQFVLRVYEPDANIDSKDEDRISLKRFEFRGEKGIRATLDDDAFEANRSHMVETGPNTGIFEVHIEIPRHLDDKVVHIGSEYEIIYTDITTPSNTNEEIILKGKIGR